MLIREIGFIWIAWNSKNKLYLFQNKREND